jgi:hypothetical protein
MKPKTAKKIKGDSSAAQAKGLSKYNIEAMRYVFLGCPPEGKDGLTAEEYKKYLEFKYGSYNSPENIRKRQILTDRMVFGKDTPWE